VRPDNVGGKYPNRTHPEPSGGIRRHPERAKTHQKPQNRFGAVFRRMYQAKEEGKDDFLKKL
jgi:hypothetical protein